MLIFVEVSHFWIRHCKLNKPINYYKIYYKAYYSALYFKDQISQLYALNDCNKTIELKCCINT